MAGTIWALYLTVEFCRAHDGVTANAPRSVVSSDVFKSCPESTTGSRQLSGSKFQTVAWASTERTCDIDGVLPFRRSLPTPPLVIVYHLL